MRMAARCFITVQRRSSAPSTRPAANSTASSVTPSADHSSYPQIPRTRPIKGLMPKPTLELADIFRQYGPAYRQAHALPLHQHRLMQAIEACRTAALGGTVESCDHCQYTHTRYRSCRNRHCPKCQGLAAILFT